MVSFIGKIKHAGVFIFITAALLLIPFVTAQADVLIEPDNEFWRKNTNKMKNAIHNYYSNGEAGYITFTAAPGSAREVFSIQNGVYIYITHIYDDNGTLWGITERNIGNENRSVWRTGWVKMNELYIIYDSHIFHNEHANDFISRDFNVQDYYTDGDLILWTWPGSGKISLTLKSSDIDSGDVPIDITGDVIYTDPNGHEWGYVSYLYGSRNIWICLSDPSNNEIPAFNRAPEPNLIAAIEPPIAGSGITGWISTPVIVIILVSSVVVLSLVLIYLMRNKKAKN